MRYAPFVTTSMSRKLPEADAGPGDRSWTRCWPSLDKVEDREIRLLGVRAEMAMPDDADPADRTPVRGRI